MYEKMKVFVVYMYEILGVFQKIKFQAYYLSLLSRHLYLPLHLFEVQVFEYHLTHLLDHCLHFLFVLFQQKEHCFMTLVFPDIM